MTDRVKRMKKLLAVQEQLKALHETRHAGFVAQAGAAAQDAADLAARLDGDEATPTLFPELYHRRIDRALAREAASRRMANAEAGKVATATVRTNMVERAYREVRALDEREKGDRERLDLIAGRAKPAR